MISTLIFVVGHFFSHAQNTQSQKDIYEAGRVLIKTSCISCHSVNSTIAPSLPEILKFYRENEKQPKENLKAFLLFQEEDNIKMKAALKKYGRMPKMTLTAPDVKSILHYLTTTDFNDFQKEVDTTKESPLAKGKRIASMTKSEIGENLMGAIKKYQVVGAIDFCNEKAIPITLAHAKKAGAIIKRATDKPRNKSNLADTEESSVIKSYIAAKASGQPLEPRIIDKDGEYHFYAPIVTNSLCLKCHGSAESEIEPAVIKKINNLYPEDQAKGYSDDQIRGVFSVRWKK